MTGNQSELTDNQGKNTEKIINELWKFCCHEIPQNNLNNEASGVKGTH